MLGKEEISATEEAPGVKRDVGSYDKTIVNELENVNAKCCKQIRTNLTLDLECYAIANYFKLLIKWGQEVDISEAAVSLMPCDDGRQEISEECNTMLLWGEDPTRADGLVRMSCSINVILENKAKNYGLLISSFCSKEAEARIKRMRNLAAIAVSMRQTIPMRDWCPQHREAINESDALRDILNKTKSAVLFHESKDKVISADVVGLTEHDQITVRLFLEALIPRQAEWNVPQESISDYTASSWIEIRRIFAIKLDIKGGDKRGVKGINGGQKNSKALKVWGFEPAMEKALKFILTPSARKDSIPYIQKVLTSSPSITMSRKVAIDRVSDSMPSRIDSNTDPARRSKVCLSDNQGREGDVRMKNPLSLDIARLAVKDKTQFVGHFVFLDREAGMLYQSFEFEFQTYLQQKYNVMMRCSQSTVSESGAMENSVSSGHCRQTGNYFFEMTCLRPCQIFHNSINLQAQILRPWHSFGRQVSTTFCHMNCLENLTHIVYL